MKTLFSLSRFGLLALLALATLSACSHPREKYSAPKTAEELAQTQMPGSPALEKNRPTIADLPIPEQPNPSPNINRNGSLPNISHYQEQQPRLPHAPASENVVELNMEQIELRALLELIADTMNISIVLDPSISGKITIRTAPGKPLKQADLWPLLQLLMSENSITIEQRGQVYYLKKQENLLPVEIGSASSSLTNSSTPEVLQITPLRFISMDSGLAALKPLVEPHGRLITLDNLNLMGIITSPNRLRKINRLLSLIDADPFAHRGMQLFRLNNAKASEIKQDLDNVLKAVEGKMPAYESIALERINALLVVAPPRRGFEQVARWIQILDEENEAGGEQVFIYHVRNLKAADLAGTLSEVFQLDNEEQKKRQRQKTEKAKTPQKTANKQVKSTPATKAVKKTTSVAAVSAELNVTIVADESTNSLLIRSTPRDYRQLLNTIALLDAVPQEVMINVVVAEVELTNEHKFGIDWSALFGNALSVGIEVPGLSGASTDAGVIGSSSGGISIGFLGKDISALLTALDGEGQVELLSRPSLLVRNNEEASINVGSDEPVITRSNTTTGTTIGNPTTSNEVQYRKTGIILKVTPHINKDGIINMEIRQEVSTPGPARTEQQLPSFNERVIETSLVVRDGSAIVMGGLIQTLWTNGFTGTPYLQDVPIMGGLFRTDSVKRERRELVIFIMPQIIYPEADNREYVRRFRDRMKGVKALMENDSTPIFFDRQQMPPPVVPEKTAATEVES
ncbi:type II secretion system secretin GspD [Candidatus Venteria ishoeyi]|nr:type II secretion system secretin GspD [Candidatus Venteria ishoeyi]